MEQKGNLNKTRYRKFRRLLQHRAFTVAAAVVVFVTTYALILPAITVSADTYCGKEEHTHTDACYTTEKVLTCGKEECEGHTHTDACYEITNELVCGEEESEGHVHSDACYTEEKVLTCTNTDPDHTHDDSCYSTEMVLTCGKTEGEGAHHHDDTCYQEEKTLICGKEESEGHTHDDSCYTEEKTLTCSEEEHEHTKACFSNPNADLETAASWTNTFKNAKLTGNWSEDILTIAYTQLGYKESTSNYILSDSGEKKGYTRYGAWFGDTYGDWCAMFSSFCTNYAGIPTTESQARQLAAERLAADPDADDSIVYFPIAEGCQHWIELLNRAETPYYYAVNDKNSYALVNGKNAICWNDPEEELEEAQKAAEEAAEAAADTEGTESAELTEDGTETTAASEELTIDDACGLYHPQAGDLIFFNWDSQPDADHVGIVTSVDYASDGSVKTIHTIEGNSGNAVKENKYSADNSKIMGFARMPENPGYEEAEAEDQIESTEVLETESTEVEEETESNEEVEEQTGVYQYEDDSLSVTATLENPEAIPADAVLTITPITAESEDYNYEAYVEALNGEIGETDAADETDEGEEATVVFGEGCTDNTYTDDNILMYDVAFLGTETDEEGNTTTVEYQPTEGSVTLNFEFKNNQLTDLAKEAGAETTDDTAESDEAAENTVEADAQTIEVVHMPLTEEAREEVSTTAEATDITAADVAPEILDAEITISDTDVDTAQLTMSSFSTVTFANNGTSGNGQSTTVTTAQGLYNAVRNGYTTIKLGANIDFTYKPTNSNYTFRSITLNSGANLTIDLNGYTLTEETNTTYDGSALFNVNTGATLTITDSAASSGKYTDTKTAASTTNKYGNAATYSNNTLTYYVTETAAGTTKGTTTETVYKHTVNMANAGKINCNSKAPAIYVNGGTVNFNGGLIYGSTASAIVGTTNTASVLNLKGGYIAGCTAANNATVSLNADDIAQTGVTFHGGGAVKMLGGQLNIGTDSTVKNPGLDIQGTVLAGNSSDSGGAIYAQSTTVQMDGGIITGNTATAVVANRQWINNTYNVWEMTMQGGGGVFIQDGSFTMTNGYLTNNSFYGSSYFDGGAGILLKGTSTMNMSGTSKITGNYSERGGGGIKLARNSKAVLNMTNGYISSNVADLAEGGAVHVDRDAVGNFSGGYITNNQCLSQENWGGGGLYTADGSNTHLPGEIFLKNSVITSNTAGGFGGGVAGCSTGRIYVFVENGGAIYGNTASGTNLSGTTSAKADDHTAANTAVFTENGYQDYFCALASSVSAAMLGGGHEVWVGSADGEKVASTSSSDTLMAEKLMGLTSNSTSTDRSKAMDAAELYISGNYAYTHGGGVLANGYLVIGSTDEIDIPARLELGGTKVLDDGSGNAKTLSDKQFTFLVTDANGTVVSKGTNDTDGTITFDRNISFNNLGTEKLEAGQTADYVYYIKEASSTSSDGILYDTTSYKMTISLKVVEEDALTYLDASQKEVSVKRYQIQFTNVKIVKSTDGVNYDEDNPVYNSNPGNDEQHSVNLGNVYLFSFTNHDVSTIDYIVKKVWDGNPGADSVTVHLLRNGTEYKSATLSASNNWTYLWEDLDAKDSSGNVYTYTVKEDKVSGYVVSYGYATQAAGVSVTHGITTTSGTEKTYWVQVNSNESLQSGTQYAIVNSGFSKVLNISSTHHDARLTSADYTNITATRNTTSITLNGTSYSSWYEGDVFTGAEVWVTDTKTDTPNEGATILKNNSYDGWLANETNAEVKTTSGGGKMYASRVQLSNGRLQLQQGYLVNNNTNSYRYVYMGNSNVNVSTSTNYAVYVFKKVTVTTDPVETTTIGTTTTENWSTTATITNTPVENEKFKVNLHKVSEEDPTLPLSNAKFNLLDSTNTAMKFTLDSDGYYKPDTNGSTELLITSSTGYIRIKELDTGSYTMKEVYAPSGYGRAADYSFTLNEDTTDLTLNIEIQDPEAYYELPKTGGIGTTPFTIAGLLLMAAAVFLTVLKQKGKTGKV